MNNKTRLIIVVVVLVIVIFAGLYWGLSSDLPDMQPSDSPSVQVKTSDPVILSLAPSATTVSSGSTFTMDVMMENKTYVVDGVDVTINFDAQFLEVVDKNSIDSGVQVESSKLFPETLMNKVDNKAGIVEFSQTSSITDSTKLTGKLATITFRAKKEGQSMVKFEFTAGKTTDSNVAFQGEDKLTNVVNAQVVVEK